MSRYAILSDIHGNDHALKMIVEDMKRQEISAVILLGDLIDYGMRSNQVVYYIEHEIPYKIICSLWGNHENAIMTEDFSRFSSQRGVESAKYTMKVLSVDTKKFIQDRCNSTGMEVFELDGKRCLAVHGSLEDYFWKGILPNDVRGDYSGYDIVFSGHTHYSHFFHKFYDSPDTSMRNQKAVYFLNPGSVGQPRNHNPLAQYAVLDTETLCVDMRAVRYDIKAVQSLYSDVVSEFYKNRLEKGV